MNEQNLFFVQKINVYFEQVRFNWKAIADVNIIGIKCKRSISFACERLSVK